MKKSPPENKSNGGFTIMETMIALSLLGMGIMAMTAMQITSTSSTTTSEVLTQNVLNGMSFFEKLVAEPYDTISDGSVTENIYTVAWNVSPAGIPIPNTKAISITMYANRGGSKNEGNMSFIYYKSDKF